MVSENMLKKFYRFNDKFKELELDLNKSTCRKNKKFPYAPKMDFWSTEIDKMDSSSFIFNGDFAIENEDSGNQLLITNLIGEIQYIINLDRIDEKEIDDNFSKYLKITSEIIQDIIDQMFENRWNFDPIEKFSWIYLTMGCKYEPRVIKYLLDSPYFFRPTLVKKDKSGGTPLFYAILNHNLDIAILEDYIKIEYLEEIYFNKYPLALYSTLNTKNYSYLANNFELVNNINYLNCGITPLLYSCIYNEETAKYILGHSTISKSDFDEIDFHGMSCLMYSIYYAPNLLPVLLKSSFCSSGIVNFRNGDYGNILTLALKYNDSLVDEILNSEFIDENIFIINDYENILDYCCDVDIFTKIIRHPKFPQNKFNEELHKNNMLNRISFKYPNVIKVLIEDNYIDTIDLISLDKLKLSPLLIGAILKPSLVSIIYESKLWIDANITHEYKNSGKNIIMLLLENNTNIERKKIVKKMYCDNKITENIIKYQDYQGYNLLWYFCKYYPKIIKYLIKDKVDISQFFNNEMFNKICHYSSGKTIARIFSSGYLSINHINDTDQYGNNLLLQASLFRNDIIDTIINSHLFNYETIECTNINSDNCLTLFLKFGYHESKISILKNLVNHQLINQDIINHKNNYFDTPFLLACQNSLEFVKEIIDSKYFDKESFYSKSLTGKNCFSFACDTQNLDLIKYICNHPFFNESLFVSKDSADIPYFLNSVKNNREIAEFIMTHQYFNTDLLNSLYEYLLRRQLEQWLIELVILSPFCTIEILLKRDINGCNCLMLAVMKDNLFLVNKIIDLPLFKSNNELLMQLDMTGDTIFHKVNTLPIIKLLLGSEKLNSDIFLIKNSSHYNALLYLDSVCKFDILNQIIISGKCPIESLKIGNNISSNILVKIFTYPTNLMGNILKLHLTKEDMLTTDHYGNTCLHYFAKNKINEYLTINNIENIFDNLENLFGDLFNQDIFSAELLEKRNSNGDTFIIINPYLIKLVLGSKYCTNNLFCIANNENMTFIWLLCTKYDFLLKYLINNHYFNTELLFEYNLDYGMHPFNYLCINGKKEILKLVLDAPLINISQQINMVDDLGYSPISYAMTAHNYETVEALLESKYDLSPSFNYIYPNERNLLMLSALTNEFIFELLIGSKYVTEEMFLVSNKFKHNVSILVFNKTVEMVKILINSKFWSPNLMYHTDIDKDYLMLYPCENPKLVKYLLKSKKCDYAMVSITNNFGMNCAHYYSKYNSKSFKYLLRSKIVTKELFWCKDKLGNNCVHLAAKYNPQSIIEILKSKFVSIDILLEQNGKGKNSLMVLSKYHPSYLQYIWEKYPDVYKLVKKKDFKRNNLLFYLIKYDQKSAEKIVKSSLCKTKLLAHKNIKNMNCYLYACKYNGNLMELFLSFDFTDNEMLYFGHMDYGSCLTLASRYQPIAIKYILNWEKLDWKIIETLYKKRNFLTIASKYNQIGIKYALESNIDLYNLIYCNTDETPFLNGCRYNPEVVKYLLDSKYESLSMILAKIGGKTYLEEAYDNQPKALAYILKSKYGELLVNLEDDRGYRLAFKIKSVFSNFSSVKDIDNINLTHYDNELSEDYNLICEICCTYKKKVLFYPCLHTICLGCGFKIKNCHKCRSQIEQRKIIYE